MSRLPPGPSRPDPRVPCARRFRSGAPAGGSSATGARGETGTPSFHEIGPPSGELFANPAASQAMLDDAQFDVEGWLASEIAMEFAKAEGVAFVNGTGVNQPKGFLQSPVTDEVDDVRAFGALQYVASGAADGFAAAKIGSAHV